MRNRDFVRYRMPVVLESWYNRLTFLIAGFIMGIILLILKGINKVLYSKNDPNWSNVYKGFSYMIQIKNF